MPISDDATLRAFIERLLGWSDERTVELAARSLALALGHRETLVLCGEGDLVPIAQALHRRALARPGSHGGTPRDDVGVAEPVARPTGVAPMMPADHVSHRVEAGRLAVSAAVSTSDRGRRPAPVGSVTHAGR